MTTRTKARPQKASAPHALERVPPSNVEAEHCVLGSMLIYQDCCDDVALALSPEDFYDEANQTLYRRMMSIHEAGKTLDVTLLVDALQKAGEYEAVGGPSQLARVTQAVPNAAHAVYYANIVHRLAVHRAMIVAGSSILQHAYSADGEPDELIAQAEQAVFAIAERRASEPETVGNLMIDALEEIDGRMRTKTGGISTGFAHLDAMLGGMRSGELIVVAARPSMGKTSLALNVCEHASLQGEVCTLLVSLEMSAMEVCERLLCSNARVPLYRCRNGSLSREQMSDLVDAQSRIHPAWLYIDDTPTCRVSQVAAKARRLKRKRNLGLIVVDYLQLLEADDSRAPREQQVAAMARQLKMLAKQVGVPVIVVAQLNRQTESAKDNRPRLSHLRESGAIEQDADVVLFVHREAYYLHGEAAREKEGEACVIVAKQRNGPIGDVRLVWFKEHTRFAEPAPERYSEFDAFNRGEEF